MRARLRAPRRGAARGERARADLRERHSPEAAGKVMRARLERVHGGSRPGCAAARLDAGDGRAAAAARPRGRRAADARRSTASGARRSSRARRCCARLKPYTAHARQVDLGDHSLASEYMDQRADRRGPPHGRPRRPGRRAALRPAAGARVHGLLRARRRRRRTARRWRWATGRRRPSSPWTPEYVERHRAFVTRALDDPALLNLLKSDRAAAGGLRRRLRRARGRVPVGRDARPRRPRARRRLDAQPPARADPAAAARRGAAHRHAGARAAGVPVPRRLLPLRRPARAADARRRLRPVLSISTLEHVGMDNTQYGDASERSRGARADLAAAMRELRRVLKPGGTLYVTVPYGRAADIGWQRDLRRRPGSTSSSRPSGPRRESREFFRYDLEGWQRSDAEEAARRGLPRPLRRPDPRLRPRRRRARGRGVRRAARARARRPPQSSSASRGARLLNTMSPSATASDQPDGDEQQHVRADRLRGARRLRIDHRVTNLLVDRRERVEQRDRASVSFFSCDQLDGIQDRGQVESHLYHHAPDRLDIAEPQEQHGQQHRQPGGPEPQ